jgi:outer membrane cobalamin receptor
MARCFTGRLLVVLFLLIAVRARAAPALAQALTPDSLRADRDTVYRVPGVTVHEHRPALSRDLALRPGFAASYRMDDAPSPTATAADVLSQAVGVHVRQFGGLNAYSGLSVRGSDATQVAVYLDGVPLNQAQYGVVSASDLPAASLAAIEVYRGTAPLAFGNPGGGVVNLITRDVSGKAAATRVSYGTWDTRRAQGWGSWARGPARFFGAYEFRGSRGDFEFKDDNGTPRNQADDEWASRLNNAFTSNEGTGKLDWALGKGGQATLAADVLHKDSGMPGISSFQSDHAHLWTDRGVASATWRSLPLVSRALELSAQAYGTNQRDRLRDPEGDLGAGRQDTDDRTRSWGIRPQAAITAGPLGQSLELVLDARREEYHPSAELPKPRSGPTSQRDFVAYGAEERLEPWAHRLTLVGSVRRESSFDDFPAGPPYPNALPRPAVSRTTRFTPWSAGARLQIVGGLVARANAAIRHRMPTLFELFGDRGAVLGNPGLRPERLDGWDAGLTLSAHRASAEASFYRTDARDLIVFIQNSQYTSVAQNISAARLQGIELSGSAGWHALTATANGTWQDTHDRSGVPFWTNRELPGRPPYEAFTRLEARRRSVRGFYEFQYTSGNFLDRANLAPVAPRRLHNAGVTWEWSRHRLQLTAEAKNLGDDRVQDVAGYPLPGRALALSADARF